MLLALPGRAPSCLPAGFPWYHLVVPVVVARITAARVHHLAFWRVETLLLHLFIHLFRTCCERSFKVRSPGHVKWPHLRKSWNARYSYHRFDASHQEKHYSGKVNALALLGLKLLQKKLSQKTSILEFLLSAGQTVHLRLNLRHVGDIANRAIGCLFSGRCSSSGSRVRSRIIDNFWKRQKFTFGDLW